MALTPQELGDLAWRDYDDPLAPSPSTEHEPLKSEIRDFVAGVQSALDLLEASQAAGLILEKTWTALSARSTTGLVSGAPAVVLDTDTGTHTDPVSPASGVTASISTNVMTVSAGSGLKAGQVVAGTNVTAGTRIVSQASGTPGGIGVYSVDRNSTAASTAMTITVPNAGTYRYSTSPAGWEWVGDSNAVIAVSAAATATAQALAAAASAASAATAALTGDKVTAAILQRSSNDGLQPPTIYDDLAVGHEHSYARSTQDGAFRTGLVTYAAPSGDPSWSFSRTASGFGRTSGGTLTSFAAQAPRYTDLGLLIEPARTNLLLRSQEIDNAMWTKANATITANAAVAPDGTTTADKYAATATTAPVLVQIPTLAANTYVVSVYAKMVERRWLVINFQSKGADNFTYFDLQNGVVGSASGDSVPYMMALANGWYRCGVIRTATAGARQVVFQHSSSNGSVTAPTAGQGIYLWGAQVELGLDISSYIPTTTTTVTRDADLAAVSFPIGSSGFIFAEFIAPQVQSSFTVAVVAANLGTPIGISNGGMLTASSGGSLIPGVTVAKGDVVRACLTWGPGRRAFYANGTGAVDAIALDAITSLKLGNTDGTLNSQIKQLRWGNTELTNQELAALTSPASNLTGPITGSVATSTSADAIAVTAEFGGVALARFGQQSNTGFRPQSGFVELLATDGDSVVLGHYQYGAGLFVTGTQIFECFIGENPLAYGDFSIRGKVGNQGNRLNVRNGADTYGLVVAATGTANTRIGPDLAAAPDEFMLQHAGSTGYLTFKTGVDVDGNGGTEWFRVGEEGMRLKQRATAPTPPTGYTVLWAKTDGTVQKTSNVGGTTTTAQL